MFRCSFSSVLIGTSCNFLTVSQGIASTFLSLSVCLWLGRFDCYECFLPNTVSTFKLYCQAGVTCISCRARCKVYFRLVLLCLLILNPTVQPHPVGGAPQEFWWSDKLLTKFTLHLYFAKPNYLEAAVLAACPDLSIYFGRQVVPLTGMM